MNPISAIVLEGRRVRAEATWPHPDTVKHINHLKDTDYYEIRLKEYEDHVSSLPIYDMHPSFPPVEPGQRVQGYLKAGNIPVHESGAVARGLVYQFFPLPVTEQYDPFVQKHLKNIKSKIAMYKEATQKTEELIDKHIKPLFNGLEKESVRYFLESGTVSGSFHEALTNMIFEALPTPEKPPVQDVIDKAKKWDAMQSNYEKREADFERDLAIYYEREKKLDHEDTPPVQDAGEKAYTVIFTNEQSFIDFCKWQKENSAGATASTGGSAGVWVKASERKPEKDNDDKYCRVYLVACETKSVCYIDSGRWYFSEDDRLCGLHIVNNMEWWDESLQSPGYPTPSVDLVKEAEEYGHNNLNSAYCEYNVAIKHYLAGATPRQARIEELERIIKLLKEATIEDLRAQIKELEAFKQSVITAKMANKPKTDDSDGLTFEWVTSQSRTDTEGQKGAGC